MWWLLSTSARICARCAGEQEGSVDAAMLSSAPCASSKAVSVRRIDNSASLLNSACSRVSANRHAR